MNPAMGAYAIRQQQEAAAHAAQAASMVRGSNSTSSIAISTTLTCGFKKIESGYPRLKLKGRISEAKWNKIVHDLNEIMTPIDPYVAVMLTLLGIGVFFIPCMQCGVDGNVRTYLSHLNRELAPHGVEWRYEKVGQIGIFSIDMI
jgi:hypothetical protein